MNKHINTIKHMTEPGIDPSTYETGVGRSTTEQHRPMSSVHLAPTTTNYRDQCSKNSVNLLMLVVNIWEDPLYITSVSTFL